MTHELLLAASLFSFVSSITPGPNNTLLLASGVNFGWQRSLGHLAGVRQCYAPLFAGPAATTHFQYQHGTGADCIHGAHALALTIAP